MMHGLSQINRFNYVKILYNNARMERSFIEKYCAINNDSRLLLKTVMEKIGLSARAYDRILKVSRTIADLENSENIKSHHIGEAIQYRSLDRSMWLG